MLFNQIIVSILWLEVKLLLVPFSATAIKTEELGDA